MPNPHLRLPIRGNEHSSAKSKLKHWLHINSSGNEDDAERGEGSENVEGDVNEEEDNTDELCEECSKIPFGALRLPTKDDVIGLTKGKVDLSKAPFNNSPDVTNQRFSIGSLKEVIHKSQSCRLCYLIWETLKIQPANASDLQSKLKAYTSTGHNALGNEIHTVLLSMEHWAYIAHPEVEIKEKGPGRRHTWLERLTVSLLCDETPLGDSWEAYPFILQVWDGIKDAKDGGKSAYGGRLRPEVVDTNVLKGWLRTCDEEHGASCKDAGKRGGVKSKIRPLFRALDVENKCVKEFTNVKLEDINYMALSYVWGGPQTSLLTTENRPGLLKPGSIVLDTLSETIADALLLAEKLSIPYLWVDALNIIQNDDNDKKDQIGMMADIYGSAYITTIAASGIDAHAGLPGLRAGTRTTKQIQQELVISKPKDGVGNPGANLSMLTTLRMPVRKPAHFLEGTPWFTRGWTLQERALSQRVITFTEEQVYWICGQTLFCEETDLESAKISLVHFTLNSDICLHPVYYRPGAARGWTEENFWAQYHTISERYTQRQFSFEGDMYNGFLALKQSFEEESGDKLLWGLPSSRLEFALSWDTLQHAKLRKELTTLPMTNLNIRVRYPTWSWMGWVGQAGRDVGDERIDAGDLPEIVCYVHRSKPLEFVKTADLATDLIYSRPYYRRSNSSLTKKWRKEEYPTVSLADVQRELPYLTPDFLSQTPDEYLLFFWTSVATFEVIYPQEQGQLHMVNVPPKEVKRRGMVPNLEVAPKIKDDRGEYVGETRGIIKEDLDIDGRGTGKYEFIVIGRSQLLDFPAQLAVLQVENKDRTRHRVNVGTISEEAWVRAEHKWTLVALG